MFKCCEWHGDGRKKGRAAKGEERRQKVRNVGDDNREGCRRPRVRVWFAQQQCLYAGSKLQLLCFVLTCSWK